MNAFLRKHQGGALTMGAYLLMCLLVVLLSLVR